MITVNNATRILDVIVSRSLITPCIIGMDFIRRCPKAIIQLIKDNIMYNGNKTDAISTQDEPNTNTEWNQNDNKNRVNIK